MRTTFISSRAMNEFTRLTVLKSQAKLSEASTELMSGRFADVGATIGFKTGQVVSFRQDYERIEAISKSNESVATRLKVTQTALTGLKDSSDKFLQTAITAMSSPTATLAATTEAKVQLNAMFDKLNSSYEAGYVFGGLNSDVKPMNGYFGQPAQTAVQAAFAGLGPAGSITPAAMQTFLDTTFANLFSDGVGGGWDTNWTDASSSNIKSRISTTEMIDASTNATEEPFRQMAMALTMMADLSNEQLSSETQQIVAKKASEVITAASAGISNLQATLAIPEQRIADANDRIDIQKDILERRIFQLEGVDENEATLRVTALQKEIDMSYAITGKLQNISILKYL